MRSRLPLLFLSLLVIIAVMSLACGGIGRLPESVNITPANGDGTNGPVQFSAMIYYNTKPSPVPAVSATWGACSASGDSSGVSVSSNGLAQCSSGPARSYIIYASVPIPNFKGVCNANPVSCGGSCGTVVGTALLSCP